MTSFSLIDIYKEKKMSKVISESQLNERISQLYIEERNKIIEEKWSKLGKEDKTLVVEMLRVIYPERSKLIKESKWYNTVGDIVGIFDPTGVVDLINGISYWRQGDKLFAVLSWISVIPFFGDVIAKPIAGIFKMGGASAKAFKAASLAGDAAKMAKIAKTSGPLGKMVTNVGKWGGAILEPLSKAVGKVPGVGKGLVKSVDDYVKVFKDANKVMKTGVDDAIRLTAKSNILSKQGLKLTAAEAKQLKAALESATTFRGFRDFTGKGGFSAGIGRLWGNRGTRGLMRRTKWYLGLLDFLGVGNFVGPDELEQKIDNLDQKVEEYSQTPEAQQYFNEDLAVAGNDVSSSNASQPQSVEDIWKSASMGGPTQSSTNQPTTTSSDDIFGGLFA